MGANHQLPWNLEEIYKSPVVYPVPKMDDGAVKAVFYRGLPYQGRETRVFAYYAVPSGAEGDPVPAVALVHGGGGTAFKEWVDLWVSKGYAAIAMDLEGHMPAGKTPAGDWPAHEWSGPCRMGEFGDCELPAREQWMYHAVANVMLAHSLLRECRGVDQRRIGLVGISWGGIVTGVTVGVDDRFAFAVPVYGCGYLYEADNRYGRSFAAMPEQTAEKIKRLWDPSTYLDRARLPMLWVNWTGDSHFPLHLSSKSYLTVPHATEHSFLSFQFDMGHSHRAGWLQPEVYRFADQIAKGYPALPRVLKQERIGDRLETHYSSEQAVTKAELIYTFRAGNWFNVQWFKQELLVDPTRAVVEAELPQGVEAYFIQLTNEEGCTISSPVQINS